MFPGRKKNGADLNIISHAFFNLFITEGTHQSTALIGSICSRFGSLSSTSPPTSPGPGEAVQVQLLVHLFPKRSAGARGLLRDPMPPQGPRASLPAGGEPAVDGGRVTSGVSLSSGNQRKGEEIDKNAL